MATSATVIWLVSLIAALPTEVTEETGVLLSQRVGFKHGAAVHVFTHMCLS